MFGFGPGCDSPAGRISPEGEGPRRRNKSPSPTQTEVQHCHVPHSPEAEGPACDLKGSVEARLVGLLPERERVSLMEDADGGY